MMNRIIGMTWVVLVVVVVVLDWNDGVVAVGGGSFNILFDQFTDTN